MLYKWRKEYDELGEGSFPGDGNLKLTPEQEKIHELEKKLRDIELEHSILKKSRCYFLQDRSMRYVFIKNNEGLFPIDKMCKVLEIGRRSYYLWKRSSTSNKALRKEKFKELITSVYFEFKQRYGSPRITAELQSRGYKISRVTVAKYMKEMRLRSKLAKKFKVTTDSKHNYLIMSNILNREFEQAEPSKAWVSDITYIPVKEGFLYLTTIIDLYDRKLIGWSLSNSMATQNTTLPAWRMALKNRDVSKRLIFHSDQGVQYANNMFGNTLDSYKVIRSMSRKGNC